VLYIAVSTYVAISADGTANENFKRVLFCCIDTKIKTLLEQN